MIIHRTYNMMLERRGAGARVRMLVSWNNCRTRCSITVPGIIVDESKWIKKEGRCLRNSVHFGYYAADINKRLTEYENYADMSFREYEMREEIPAAQQLRKAIENSVKYGRPDVFDDDNIESVYGRFIAQEGRQSGWSESTYKKMHTMQTLLVKALGNIHIDSVDCTALDRYVDWMVRNGYRNSYTKKNLTNIRWMLRWAKRDGAYNGNGCDYKLKLKTGENEVSYLTWEQLMAFYSADLPSLYLQRVRDVFCFCCFTGLRYSDVAKLRKSDIHDGYMYVFTQKTEDSLKIELNKYAAEILNRYSDEDMTRGLALPVISNQRYNDYLKELALLVSRQCESLARDCVTNVYYIGTKRYEERIPKVDCITTHCARRTFVVNALTLGIPAEVIMKWTGHKDYEAMKPYIAIVDSVKASEMDKFNHA